MFAEECLSLKERLDKTYLKKLKNVQHWRTTLSLRLYLSLSLLSASFIFLPPFSSFC